MRPLIFVVEDDPAIRESVCELLSDEGYRVVEAANGVEALAHLQVETPALILLDLWMPLMTGAQLLEKLRAEPRWSAVPVVILTAANDAGPTHGAVEVLRKPVRLEVLLETVARHLKRV